MIVSDKQMVVYVVFEIICVFNVLCECVWQVWSEIVQLQCWWGLKDCIIEVLCFEFWFGGFFYYVMCFGDVLFMWGCFNYCEIVVGECIVWLNLFVNEYCGIVCVLFSELCLLEIENYVIFIECDGVMMVQLCVQLFGEMFVECVYFDDLCMLLLGDGYGGMFDWFDVYFVYV